MRSSLIFICSCVIGLSKAQLPFQMFLNISDNFLPQTQISVDYDGNVNSPIKVQIDNNANQTLIWDVDCQSNLATGTNNSCGTAPTNVGCFSDDGGVASSSV